MSTLVSEAIIRASRGTAAAWTSLEYTPFRSEVDAKIIGSTDQICKAWVNFNGTGVVAIRDSYNVTSITDNGVGDYTVNFTVNMADANYSVVVSSNINSTVLGTVAVGSIGVKTYSSAPASTDASVITVQVFGA
jgi:hypothetical protein